MLDNVALNVVIGLVFIYLLYSLLASVLSEIIATYLGLRARNLKEAVDRMLNDQKREKKGPLWRLWDSLNLMKNPKNDRITNFYNYPEIKYLGSTGIFKQPSQFKSVSFSRTLLIMLSEYGYKSDRDGNTEIENAEEGDIKGIPAIPITKEIINAALEGIRADHKNINRKLEKIKQKQKTAKIAKEKEKIVPNEETAKSAEGKQVVLDLKTAKSVKEAIVLDEETAKYIQNLWNECYGDIIKFNKKLELWFDRTMEQCTEWYKRKIQIVLLVLGFMLAWFFNADTFSIISKLSTDKDARDKMVTLASAYIEAHPNRPDSPNLAASKKELDSLKVVQKKLQEDIDNGNTILGIGGWLPDATKVSFDSARQKKIYNPLVDEISLSNDHKSISDGTITFTTYDKWAYFFRLICHHFFGFLITAIAISLGAPFWFDLLNKVMQLRTSLKQDTDSASANTNTTISPLNREG